MLNIVLARHSETAWNEQLRYIGRTDLELTKLGRKNAKLMAGYFQKSDLNMLFSSDKKRTVQTADPVAASHGLKINRVASIDEIDFGSWEGLTHDEIVDGYPEISERWVDSPLSVNIPGGEPWPDFINRVWSGWREITARLSKTNMPGHDLADRNILIVTHAGPIKIILTKLLEAPIETAWRIHQDKGALNHVKIEERQTVVVRINDTDYRRTTINYEDYRNTQGAL